MKRNDFRILIAEDEPGVRKLYEKSFQAEGYEVVTAETGGQMLAELAEGTFDLLITDLQLDSMSALEALPFIRLNSGPAHSYALGRGGLESIRAGETLRRLLGQATHQQLLQVGRHGATQPDRWLLRRRRDLDAQQPTEIGSGGDGNAASAKLNRDRRGQRSIIGGPFGFLIRE